MAAPDNSAPIGSIVAFAGPPSNIPANWMVCDGRKLDKTQYSALHDRIGETWGGDGAPNFYLPDLRGQFLRGVDRKQDGKADPTKRDPERDSRDSFTPPDSPTNPGNKGNDVGSFQGSATARPGTQFVTDNPGDHHHGDPTWNGGPGQFELATSFRGPGGFDYGAQSAPTTNAGAHSHVIIGGGDSETRPINAYVYFIIRAK